MFNFRAFSIVLSLLFVFIFLGHNAHAQIDLIQNGSFETGDFTGWTTENLTSNGNWFVYTGTLSPLTNFPIAPPPEGEFAAVTDQTFPYDDANILYQDIEIFPGATVSCTAIVYITNQYEGGFVIGDGLTDTTDNQQMRVDIMDPTADPFDTGSGVLQNLFQTLPGDPIFGIDYTTLNFDLTPYAGSTVRLRVAVAATQAPLNGSIDAVSCIQVSGPSSIPTLSEWGMITAAAGLGLIGVFFAVRRKRLQAGA